MINNSNNLLNIMFHAPMGRFQLESIYYFTYLTTPVENIVLTTKGLQESNTQLLDATTVKNR